MSRVSAIQEWLNAGGSSDEFMRRWNLGGDERGSLISEVGYANEGACYNAARNAGIIPGGPIKNGDGERKARGQRGTLPVKTAMAIARALGRDPEDYDAMGWEEFSSAYGDLGRDWLELLFTRLGGRDSDAGKSFQQWIDWNLEIERAEELKRQRDADPTYQLKVKLANAQDKIASLESKIDGLENDLRQARAMAGPRRSTGGTLTAEMKRLMIQRFHPDKMNGNSPELYNAICAYINALETTD